MKTLAMARVYSIGTTKPDGTVEHHSMIDRSGDSTEQFRA